MASRIFASRSPLLTSTLCRSQVPRFCRPLLRPSIRLNTTLAPQQPQTLSARLKYLSREYGYSAVAVYFGLSALDFPFCFLAVRYFGADRIGAVEDVVVGYLKPYWISLRTAVGYPPQQSQAQEEDRWDEVKEAEEEVEKSASMS
jgi:N-terminal acetyltransferase 2